MIKTNLFRVYNSKTYERVDKLGTNYTNQFFDDDNILSPDEKNIIICGSYYMCNCLNSNSLRVFEGDILRVVERDGEQKKIKHIILYQQVISILMMTMI